MNYSSIILLLFIYSFISISATPATVSQDPQFAGFQGQSFQFHGLPDEHFNLISSPRLQINAHFVFLANGRCGYNDTLCWTHPGTYVDVVGVTIGNVRIRIIANSHHQGLSLFINEQSLGVGKYPFQDGTRNGESILIHMKDKRTVTMHTSLISMTIHNADFFFNLEVSLHDDKLLKLGSKPHTITDHQLCHQERDIQEMDLDDDDDKNDKNKMKRDHGPIEAELIKKYGAGKVPLHGLIGQTWRAATICGKSWVGSVQDYITSDLFASDYRFNYFQS